MDWNRIKRCKVNSYRDGEFLSFFVLANSIEDAIDRAHDRYSGIKITGVALEERLWDIWEEGFVATGESSGATHKGTVEANSFQEACNKLCGGDPYYDQENLTYWACKLFDNEIDARKSFG